MDMPELPWVFSRFGFQSLIDIAAVTLILFWLLSAVHGTAATQLIRGIVILLLASIVFGSILQLSTLNWVIRNSIPALLIAVPVVFQPELRRGLQKLGRTSDWLALPLSGGSNRPSVQTLSEISRASAELSEKRFGALVVLERQTGLQEYVDNGVGLDAVVSAPLLSSIFFPASSLHDGAVIIRLDRILAASCVLPLSEKVTPSDLSGTRHLAALGLSERSDAVVIVISEETGSISLAKGGEMVNHLSEGKLKSELISLFRPKEKAANEPQV